jgi:tRNA (guanine26-N2/guanine27-N2)-dimethyltransferase
MKKLKKNLSEITEGSARILVHLDNKISKDLPVFYNPHMILNRDICIALLKSLRPATACDLLAASGVRAVRIAKALPGTALVANDYSEVAVKLIKENMKRNNVSFEVSCKEGNVFLHNERGFDYIDLDVFGSPNPFLDTAIKRIARQGVLAITATDTAPLCGTYPKACHRKYWATPLHNQLMHEIGIRILIRKIQLIGAQYDKALVPIYVHYTRHYFRIYLQNVPGKKCVDELLKQHKSYDYDKETMSLVFGSSVGPLYCGPLWNLKHAQAVASQTLSKEATKLAVIALAESRINQVGFTDLHAMAKHLKIKVPSIAHVLDIIRQNKYLGARTHFSPYGIRTTMPFTELKEKILLGINQ